MSAPDLSGERREEFIGSPSQTWPAKLNLDCETAVRVAVAVVELVLPEWRENRPSDTAPLRAIDAARRHPVPPDENLRRHAQALSKACSQARRRSLGYQHRIAEAARAVASAAAAPTDAAAVEHVADAFDKTEEHFLYRLSCAAKYGHEREVRERMLSQVMATLRPDRMQEPA